MALSMDEQRILDQIERSLASSDPMLASRMASFGAPRSPLTGRVRRIRLLASFSTLLVVAAVSLVVYALVPFRAAGDRPGSSKASSPPTHPVLMAPPAATGQRATPMASSDVAASPLPHAVRSQ
ncbi:MAG TPA: DUF3040 domain-containing protein [Streptosporangiaceae bacterium]|nr:DUF3040 domain-containing protein [Streptosporangiaceae bacterium]